LSVVVSQPADQCIVVVVTTRIFTNFYEF